MRSANTVRIAAASAQLSSCACTTAAHRPLLTATNEAYSNGVEHAYLPGTAGNVMASCASYRMDAAFGR